MTSTTIMISKITVARLKGQKVIPQESFDVAINRILDELETFRMKVKA